MATAVLAINKPRSRSRSKPRIKPDAGVLSQIKSLGRSPVATVAGAIIGGFIPAATWILAHYQAPQLPMLWLLVAGGLLYSALTVYDWSRAIFGSVAKAVGFCLLLEGTLTFASGYVSLSALAILVSINAIAASYAIVVGRRIKHTEASS